MDELNREEIQRLRDRQHELGNHVQEHTAMFAQINSSLIAFGEKVEAQHASIKEDIREMRVSQEKGFEAVTRRQDIANGRLGEHDKEIAQAKGGMKMIAVGLPVVTGLLLYALVQLLFPGATA